jgi:hypothetical protein
VVQLPRALPAATPHEFDLLEGRDERQGPHDEAATLAEKKLRLRVQCLGFVGFGPVRFGLLELITRGALGVPRVYGAHFPRPRCGV